jgi:hypothetical protein
MTPLGDDDFVWTFPTYLLAKNFAVDHTTGDIYFNTDLQYIAPAVAPTGEQGIGMFTDLHLAEEYLELTSPELGLRPLEISSSKMLRDFLRHAPKKYRYVAVDPNRKTGVIRAFLIQKVLQALDGRDDGTGKDSRIDSRPR